MKNNNKMLWTEGTLLGQQHFQQWDHYHTAQLHFVAESLSPGLIGLGKFMIDEVSLGLGQVIIKQIQAILPNGLIINYDHRYDGPLSCTLKQSCEIYLGVAISNYAKHISGYPENNLNSAWVSHYEVITDDYDPKREREIGFLKPNNVLLSDEEDRSGYYSLKILDIIQTGTGKFETQLFIPPALNLSVSSIFIDSLRSQIELLSAKIRLLRSRREMTGFNQNDLTDFFLLKLFNQILPVLSFYHKHPQVHPREYYFYLTQFLSMLSSFTDPVLLPDYDHGNLYKTFSELDHIFKELLESVIPSRMSALKLKRENDVLYSVDSIDSSVFDKSGFYLAVFFEADNIDWLSKFTRQVKIGARSVIESIVASALPGVRVVHTQRPPNRLPIKSGYEYFYLEPTGYFWDQIKSERTLALFTSYDFLKAQIELVTVED